MNAKLIRTEYVNINPEYPNVWGKKYIFQCANCGNEYMKWVYNKRTTCLCSECNSKKNYEQAKAREQRKQQERINKVLEDIKTEIKQLPYQRIFGNVSNYSLLDAVVEVIDKYKAESEDKE